MPFALNRSSHKPSAASPTQPPAAYADGEGSSFPKPPVPIQLYPSGKDTRIPRKLIGGRPPDAYRKGRFRFHHRTPPPTEPHNSNPAGQSPDPNAPHSGFSHRQQLPRSR